MNGFKNQKKPRPWILAYINNSVKEYKAKTLLTIYNLQVTMGTTCCNLQRLNLWIIYVMKWWCNGHA